MTPERGRLYRGLYQPTPTEPATPVTGMFNGLMMKLAPPQDGYVWLSTPDGDVAVHHASLIKADA